MLQVEGQGGEDRLAGDERDGGSAGAARFAVEGGSSDKAANKANDDAGAPVRASSNTKQIFVFVLQCACRPRECISRCCASRAGFWRFAALVGPWRGAELQIGKARVATVRRTQAALDVARQTWEDA